MYVHIFELTEYKLSGNASKTEKIKELDTFLDKIQLVLSFETKVSMENYIKIARELYIFARIYKTLVVSTMCEKDHHILVGKKMKWTEFLCKPRGRPMHKLYKWLAIMGLILTQCECLYLSDTTNKGNKPILLTHNQMIKEFYNQDLSISERNAVSCIQTIQKNEIGRLRQAHNLISSAIYIREHFLTLKYCKSMMEYVKPDKRHQVFEEKLQAIDKALLERLNELK